MTAPGPAVTHRWARVNGIRLHYVTAGEGPPLYLLHGYPQSWFMWRKMIAPLSAHFSLVIPDLRGYGDSDKPAEGYDKRTMARDIRELARQLGHERIALAGHDRGGRVAHRYALDHGATLSAVALLDIIPTRTMFERADRGLATGTWHWFFFQVPELPELLFGSHPEACLRHFFRAWSGDPRAIEEEAVQEYLRAFRIPGTIRATLADYRAGATLDLEQDRDHEQNKIKAPLLALWGGLGRLDKAFDVLACWREKAERVEGRAIPASGHFIPEEAPEELAQELIAFLGRHG
jgi:pimeloyl-ACP methyl ester carboxylesterase